MKRLVVFGALVIGLLLGRPAWAADLSYPSFSAVITVQTDASIQVTETVVADFAVPLHGIYRSIPYRFTTTDGGQASIPIDQVSVTQDGATAQVQQTKSSDTIKLRIGNPDVTLSGQHTYTISYRAQAAANFFADHDELYWNITGDQWDAPLTNVKATIILPGTVAPADIRTTCYTGPHGSTATDCQSSASPSRVEFSANTFLTVVVGWPTGLVTKPADFDALRAKAGAGATTGWARVTGWALAGNIFFPILALIIMWTLWRRNGRDPAGKGTIIAQYDPPDGLRPAEVGVLIGQQANVNCVSATIVDLAVRGYLRIEEKDKPSWLGLSHKHDYALVELKTGDAELRVYEQELLDAIFRNPKVPAEGKQILLSAFVKKKGSVTTFQKIIKEMSADMAEREYFSADPAKARAIPLGVAAVLVFVGTMSAAAIGLALAGVIVGIFGWFMPRRTEKGVEALWHAKGFKEFLKTAERYRLQWQERQHIFEQFLPYAMVFGVAKHWSETLAPVATEAPSWYSGAPGSQFNAVLFYSSLSSFNTMLSSSAVSGAASGSSGFSGGSVGGGGGGGGGGGW